MDTFGKIRLLWYALYGSAQPVLALYLTSDQFDVVDTWVLAVNGFLATATAILAGVNVGTSPSALAEPLDTQPVQDAWADDDAGVTGGDTP